MMDQDLLQPLRDIHLPVEPGWWPPAIGWWLLALLLAVALAWAIRRLLARWRRFRPMRTARALYRELAAEFQAQRISPTHYVHGTNELLKRFAVHGARDQAMGPESGARWLHYLDERYGQAAFSRGAGRCLGSERFQRNITFDPEALDKLIGRFFARECARCWRWTHRS